MKSATSVSVWQVYNCLKRSTETCWDWSCVMKSATSISVLLYNCLNRSVPETRWDWLALCHEICNFYLSVAGVQLSEEISTWDTLGLVGLVSWNLQVLSQRGRCTTVWTDQYLRHAGTGWPCVMKSATSISVWQVYNCLKRSVPETRWDVFSPDVRIKQNTDKPHLF